LEGNDIQKLAGRLRLPVLQDLFLIEAEMNVLYNLI
jgi:hypothetical protein